VLLEYTMPYSRRPQHKTFHRHEILKSNLQLTELIYKNLSSAHWLSSPVRVFAACMKLSVSVQLLELGQSVGLLGLVISSSQGLSTCTQTQKNAQTTQTLNIHAQNGISNPRSRSPRERKQFMPQTALLP
jgi:hypothetical protein